MHLPSSQRNWSEWQVLTMVAAGMKHQQWEEPPARGPCLTQISEETEEHAAYVIHLTIKSHPGQPERGWAAAGIPLPEEFWERISIPLSSVPLEQKAPRGAVINGTKARGWGSVCERGGGRDCQRKGRCVCVCVWGLAARHFVINNFYFLFFHTQHNRISKIKQNKTADTYLTSQGSIKREGEREGQQDTKVTPLNNYV